MSEIISEPHTNRKECHRNRTVIPRHVGIIMDGNRRWAAQKKIPSYLGHKAGAERVIEIVRSASKMGVRTLTLYVFSTENWLRSKKEISKLMALLYLYVKHHKKMMVEEGISLHTIGNREKLPKRVNTILQSALEATMEGSNMNLVLALNYGARDEIVRACQEVAAKVEEGWISPNQIDEKMISDHLDTKCFKDPDLIIRTSGEMRLSNFLLWQSCYSEFYITDTLWPDFGEQELHKAILAYQMRERRLGGA